MKAAKKAETLVSEATAPKAPKSKAQPLAITAEQIAAIAAAVTQQVLDAVLRRGMFAAPAPATPLLQGHPSIPPTLSPERQHHNADVRARLATLMKQAAADRLPDTATKTDYSQAIEANWSTLIAAFYRRYIIDLRDAKRKLGVKSTVLAAERLGKLDELYSLALEIFGADASAEVRP